MAILEVDRWQSYCSACGKGADPKEQAHITRLGYGDTGDGKGCGEAYTGITALYITGYGGEREDLLRLNPDLPYLGAENPFMAPEFKPTSIVAYGTFIKGDN